MPCYYTGSAEGDAALAYKETTAELQRKLTKMTRIACDLANLTYEHDGRLRPETRKWIAAHKKLDKKVLTNKKKRGKMKK